MMAADLDALERLRAEIAERRARRAALMPDERAALETAFAAVERLKDLGWREGIYCPQDGSVFKAVQVGRSAGVFDAHYVGEWPSGQVWIHDGGDLWPDRPEGIIWRKKAPAP